MLVQGVLVLRRRVASSVWGDRCRQALALSGRRCERLQMSSVSTRTLRQVRHRAHMPFVLHAPNCIPTTTLVFEMPRSNRKMEHRRLAWTAWSFRLRSESAFDALRSVHIRQIMAPYIDSPSQQYHSSNRISASYIQSTTSVHHGSAFVFLSHTLKLAQFIHHRCTARRLRRFHHWPDVCSMLQHHMR